MNFLKRKTYTAEEHEFHNLTLILVGGLLLISRAFFFAFPFLIFLPEFLSATREKGTLQYLVMRCRFVFRSWVQTNLFFSHVLCELSSHGSTDF